MDTQEIRGLTGNINTDMPIVTNTLIKDPNETRIYRMDWSAQLGKESIANSSWTVPEGLTLVANGIVEGRNKTYIMLSGGTEETSYILTNTIVVSTGEIYERSGQLDVKQY